MRGHHVQSEGPCRATLITQWFPPEPTPVPLSIAHSLHRRGFEVDVLTGMPNYPDGKLKPGYRAWRRTTGTEHGLRVVRTPLYPSHNHSAAGRAANYLSYAASSSALGAKALRGADVALVYSGPATAATAAMTARLRWRTPYVAMVMDLWPDSVFASGFLTGGVSRRVAENALSWFTNQTYRRADHVTVTSPGQRDAIVARGVAPDRVSVVYNWVDEKVMHPTEPDGELRRQLGLTDEFVVMYGGNHGMAQRLDVAIEALARLDDLSDVHLVLVGDGIEKRALQSLADRLRLRTVHFLPAQPPERMAGLMASADIQLVSLADEPLFRITMPSKIQSIFACGQPVVACVPGDASRVVDEAGAGLTCPPGDPAGLAAALRQAHAASADRRRAMGQAGRAYYLEHMSESVSSQLLADVAVACAARNTGRVPRGRGQEMA
ncbi:glycosyltransferase involved in cell wall biosynthesis [Micromonospora palomenae]|uniref:Glycosyltransferase involved in cell wall biosynthesis n=1 Tax=Micromonospora palomenae TaxID=1461247 RepID=A0A561WYI5_9ACTN|nr:glycosyltransferase family 4 protein [Micromonospora palomenae]TWG28920.1 glycosyltransferase involved in cell wall biosynthesis [Micromonospora palomenae]